MDRKQVFIPALTYQDPMAALKWLEKAFGFETSMVITGPDGKYDPRMFHSQMNFGDATIMVGGEWSERHRSPNSANGITTQTIHVAVASDIDGHCARARASGAVILEEPSDQFYGDRTYRAADPEGHIWNFGQTIKNVTRDEAEKATGLKIKAETWK